ncbi:MAG: PadR family transcriptional regulator [Planctomycetota bacterium]|nr:MAG: PadR family transcriptional regulator [Planctomycetota bacterium]
MGMDTELIKGTLSLLILSLLSRKPMYGYEIATTVGQDTGGAFDWKEGSLYPSLHKLEKDGLIRGQWQGKPGERRRKYYHLTKGGRAVLVEKSESWGQLCRAVNQVLEKSK